jgi:hypothetical protein
MHLNYDITIVMWNKIEQTFPDIQVHKSPFLTDKDTM